MAAPEKVGLIISIEGVKKFVEELVTAQNSVKTLDEEMGAIVDAFNTLSATISSLKPVNLNDKVQLEGIRTRLSDVAQGFSFVQTQMDTTRDTFINAGSGFSSYAEGVGLVEDALIETKTDISDMEKSVTDLNTDVDTSIKDFAKFKTALQEIDVSKVTDKAFAELITNMGLFAEAFEQLSFATSTGNPTADVDEFFSSVNRANVEKLNGVSEAINYFIDALNGVKTKGNLQNNVQALSALGPFLQSMGNIRPSNIVKIAKEGKPLVAFINSLTGVTKPKLDVLNQVVATIERMGKLRLNKGAISSLEKLTITLANFTKKISGKNIATNVDLAVAAINNFVTAAGKIGDVGPQLQGLVAVVTTFEKAGKSIATFVDAISSIAKLDLKALGTSVTTIANSVAELRDALYGSNLNLYAYTDGLTAMAKALKAFGEAFSSIGRRSTIPNFAKNVDIAVVALNELADGVDPTKFLEKVAPFTKSLEELTVALKLIKQVAGKSTINSLISVDLEKERQNTIKLRNSQRDLAKTSGILGKAIKALVVAFIGMKIIVPLAKAIAKISWKTVVAGAKLFAVALKALAKVVATVVVALAKLALALIKIPFKIAIASTKLFIAALKTLVSVTISVISAITQFTVSVLKLIIKVSLLKQALKLLLLPFKLLVAVMEALSSAFNKLFTKFTSSKTKTKELSAAEKQLVVDTNALAASQNKLQVELVQSTTSTNKFKTALKGIAAVGAVAAILKAASAVSKFTKTLNVVKSIIAFGIAFKSLQIIANSLSMSFQQLRFQLQQLGKTAFNAAADYEGLTLSLTSLVNLEYKSLGIGAAYIDQQAASLVDSLRASQDYRLSLQGLDAVTNATDASLQQFINTQKEENAVIDEQAEALVASLRAAQEYDQGLGALANAQAKNKGTYSDLGVTQTVANIEQPNIDDFSKKNVSVEATLEIDTAQADDAILSSTDRVQELLRWIRLTAVASPFTEKDVAEIFQYGLSTGIASDKMQELTQNVVDFGAATKATPDQMKSVVRALGQMRNIGNLTKEDLNQLSEAGFYKPIQALIDGIDGLDTSAEVLDAITDKAIGGEQAFEIFSRRMRTDFIGSAAAATTTLSGLASTLISVRDGMLREFATPAFEIFKPIIAGFTGTEQIDTLFDAAKALGEQFATKVASAVERLVALFGTLKGILEAIPQPVIDATKQFFKYTAIIVGGLAALFAFKIGLVLIASAIGLLVSPLGLAIAAFIAFRTTIITAFSAAVKAITAFAKAVNTALTPIKPIITAAGNWFNTTVESISNRLSSLGKRMATYGSNIVIQFANGMVSAIGAVANAIAGIASMITTWLSPGSPPKALPHIDQWGTDAATEFVKGFSDADLSGIDDFATLIEGAVSAFEIAPGTIDVNDIALDYANLISSLNSGGDTDDAILTFMQELQKETGDAFVNFEGLADQYIDLAIEQSKLTALTDEYNQALAETNSTIEELDAAQAFADQTKELNATDRALTNIYLSEESRAALELKRKRILAEQAKAQIDAQQASVDAAKAEIATTKQRLDLDKRFSDPIDAANVAGGSSRLDDISDKLKELKAGELVDLSEVGDGLAESLEGTLEPVTNLQSALEELDKTKLDIGGIFDAAKEKITLRITEMRTQLEEMGLSLTTLKNIAIAVGIAIAGGLLISTFASLTTIITGLVVALGPFIAIAASLAVAGGLIGGALWLVGTAISPTLFTDAKSTLESFGTSVQTFFEQYQAGIEEGESATPFADVVDGLFAGDTAKVATGLGTLTANLKTLITTTFTNLKNTIVQVVQENFLAPFYAAFSIDASEIDDTQIDMRPLLQRIYDGLVAVAKTIGPKIKTLLKETFSFGGLAGLFVGDIEKLSQDYVDALQRFGGSIVKNVQEYLIKPFVDAFSLNDEDGAEDGRTFIQRFTDGIKAAVASAGPALVQAIKDFVNDKIITPFTTAFDGEDGNIGQKILAGIGNIFQPLADYLLSFDTIALLKDTIKEKITEPFTTAFTEFGEDFDAATLAEQIEAGIKAVVDSLKVTIKASEIFTIDSNIPAIANLIQKFEDFKASIPTEVLEAFGTLWTRFQENLETAGLSEKFARLAVSLGELGKIVGVVFAGIALFAAALLAELPVIIGGVVDIITGIIDVVTSFVDIFIAIFTGGDIIGAIKTFFSSFGLIEQGLSAIFESIINGLINLAVFVTTAIGDRMPASLEAGLRNIAEIVGNILGWIFTLIVGNKLKIFSAIGNWFKGIGKAFGPFLKFIYKVFGSLGSLILKLITKSFPVLTKGLNALFVFLGQQLYKIIYIWLPNMAQALWAGLPRFLAVLKEIFGKRVLAAIAGWFAAIGAGIATFFIAAWVETLEPKIQAAKDNVRNHFIEMGNNIRDTIQGWKDSITTKLDEMKAAFLLPFQLIATEAALLWGGIGVSINEKVQALRDGVVDKFNDLKDSVITALSNITNSETIQNIITRFDNLKYRIDNLITAAGNFLDAFSFGEGTFDIQNFLDQFTNLYEKIFDATAAIGDFILAVTIDLLPNPFELIKTGMEFILGAPEGILDATNSIVETITNIDLPDFMLPVVEGIMAFLTFPLQIGEAVANIFTSVTGLVLPNPFEVLNNGIVTILTALDTLKTKIDNFDVSFPEINFPNLPGWLGGDGGNANADAKSAGEDDVTAYTEGVSDALARASAATVNVSDILTANRDEFAAYGNAEMAQPLVDGTSAGLADADITPATTTFADKLKTSWK
jgi:hypothetical protein